MCADNVVASEEIRVARVYCGYEDNSAGCDKNVCPARQLDEGGCNWLAAESLHMQHASGNARRAGVGLRHVEGEMVLVPGGGGGGNDR